MSDLKIKVNVELSDDLKDLIQKEVEKHLKESIVKMDGESYVWSKVTDGNMSSEMLSLNNYVEFKVGKNDAQKPYLTVDERFNQLEEKVDRLLSEIAKQVNEAINKNIIDIINKL